MSALTHGDLFAGLGGFSLAAQRAGIDTRWSVEIDPIARGVLASHWPDVERFEDVREVGAHNLTPVDVITFGSPCQDLSVAGKRAGLGGERSGLFHEAIRIIRELRPTIAIWEQVPGVLSSNGGRDFGIALDALADIGALDIAWSVLDAQYWRIPQRRRRVFTVIDFAGHRASQVLALADGLSGHPAPRREAGQAVADRASSGAGGRGDHVIAGTLSRRTGKGPNTTLDDGALVFESRFARNGRGAPEPVCPPLKAQSGQTGKGDSAPLVMGMTVRRLTPVEAERLMGLPDGWTDGHADSHRYRMLGNSVVVNVVEWLLRRVVAVMTE